ncbi:MAG: hypothetical protein SOX61_01400 [Prevotella sp.]|nr:hypothetical protein [Prevotella sp.]
MVKKDIEIVLDADVIIHFAKGEMLSILPSIFPDYKYVVLDIVKNEVLPPVLGQLEKQMIYMKNIQEVKFGHTHEERKEFARLTSQLGLGRGESASMVYCRFHDNVLGSSNLRDIIDYCDEYGINYLTTIDFLFYAIKRGIITKEEADEFIEKVRNKNSRLPNVDFSTYKCDKLSIVS